VSDPKRDVEKLIEDGLIRYGGGDLAGALATWERALIQDPSNLQAMGYVDYVRQVFEQLNRPTRDELMVPFGLGHGDAPDYQIDISPEPPDDDALQPSSALQDGWLIGQDDERDTLERLYSLAEPPGTLDLDYDDPQLDALASSGDTAEFGDETPVHPGQALPVHDTQDQDDDFDGPEFEATPGFLEAAAATPGFHDEPEVTPGFSEAAVGTDLRRPDLGFVKARAKRPSTVRSGGAVDPTSEPVRARREGRPEVSSTSQPAAVANAPLSTRAAIDPRSPWSALTESPSPPTEEDSLADAYANLDLAPLIEELPPSVDASDLEMGSPRARQETLTRNLGLAGRYRPREDSKFGEESPTSELPRHSTEEDEKTQAWPGAGAPSRPGGDPLEVLISQILPKIERDVPPDETRDARLRRRIGTLVELGTEWIRIGDAPRAVAAADLALAEDPDSALAQKLIHRNRDAIMAIFQAFLGSLEQRPGLARALDELGASPIGARAAFLLSRVDGHLTFDEILDVSGMPRLEAYRYLCQLKIRGILIVE
jgi:hypothetical protein